MVFSETHLTRGPSPRNRDLKEPRSAYFPGRAMVLRVLGLKDQRLGIDGDGWDCNWTQKKTLGCIGEICHVMI